MPLANYGFAANKLQAETCILRKILSALAKAFSEV
jgi:hypothetical protein